MSAKKPTGGRTTPKGTKPAAAPSATDRAASRGFTPPRTPPGRPEQAHGRDRFGPVGPTRSGHHRGNR